MTAVIGSAFNSRFVIDGVPEELSPAQLLSNVLRSGEPAPEPEGTVMDESLDPQIGHYDYTTLAPEKYLRLLRAPGRQLPMAYSDTFTRTRIASALLEALWRKGHYRIGDLCLEGRWFWNDAAVGNMAAFYRSVEAASDYIDSLGLSMSGYSLETVQDPDVFFKVSLLGGPDAEEEFEQPYRSSRPRLYAGRMYPSTLIPDPKSWIVYIPFDTSEYRMGGSLLCSKTGIAAGTSPKIEDGDYFIDCFEVVRELVEDGLLLSAATVGEGGLLRTLDLMSSGRAGADIDISDAVKSSGAPDPARFLFAEVPGAVIQIKDIDFDYLDAELLLQDVAFYPLGHPVPGRRKVSVKSSSKSGIQTIIDSLLRVQGAEGED